MNIFFYKQLPLYGSSLLASKQEEPETHIEHKVKSILIILEICPTDCEITDFFKQMICLPSSLLTQHYETCLPWLSSPTDWITRSLQKP